MGFLLGKKLEDFRGFPQVADAARWELPRKRMPQSAGSDFHLRSNRLAPDPVRLEGYSLTSDDLLDD